MAGADQVRGILDRSHAGKLPKNQRLNTRRLSCSVFTRNAGKGSRIGALLDAWKVATMIEKIQEPIEVLTKFLEGKILPLRFRWRGRTFTVSETTGNWIKRVGEHRVHYFSVGVGTKDSYELSYEARTSRWTLENIYLEG